MKKTRLEKIAAAAAAVQAAPAEQAAPTSLADALVASSKKAYIMKSDDQVSYRAEIIKRAYESSKTDHALKTIIFVYYVKEVKKQGFTIDQILPFFKTEITTLFITRKLREIAADETTKEKVDADVVYKTIKRLFSQAADRFDRAAGTSDKGPDDDRADPLAAIRSTFEQKSIVNIADAFWQIKSEKRKEDIIKALFSKLTIESKEALYLELEAMTEAEE